MKYEHMIFNINKGNFDSVNEELNEMSNEDVRQLISEETFMHRNTILHYVFSSGHEKIINLFLNQISNQRLDYESLIQKQNRGGYTPIDRVMQKDTTYARTLVDTLKANHNETIKITDIPQKVIDHADTAPQPEPAWTWGDVVKWGVTGLVGFGTTAFGWKKGKSAYDLYQAKDAKKAEFGDLLGQHPRAEELQARFEQEYLEGKTLQEVQQIQVNDVWQTIYGQDIEEKSGVLDNLNIGVTSIFQTTTKEFLTIFQNFDPFEEAELEQLLNNKIREVVNQHQALLQGYWTQKNRIVTETASDVVNKLYKAKLQINLELIKKGLGLFGHYRSDAITQLKFTDFDGQEKEILLQEVHGQVQLLRQIGQNDQLNVIDVSVQIDFAELMIEQNQGKIGKVQGMVNEKRQEIEQIRRQATHQENVPSNEVVLNIYREIKQSERDNEAQLKQQKEGLAQEVQEAKTQAKQIIDETINQQVGQLTWEAVQQSPEQVNLLYSGIIEEFQMEEGEPEIGNYKKSFITSFIETLQVEQNQWQGQWQQHQTVPIFFNREQVGNKLSELKIEMIRQYEEALQPQPAISVQQTNAYKEFVQEQNIGNQEIVAKQEDEQLEKVAKEAKFKKTGSLEVIKMQQEEELNGEYKAEGSIPLAEAIEIYGKPIARTTGGEDYIVFDPLPEQSSQYDCEGLSVINVGTQNPCMGDCFWQALKIDSDFGGLGQIGYLKGKHTSHAVYSIDGNLLNQHIMSSHLFEIQALQVPKNQEAFYTGFPTTDTGTSQAEYNEYQLIPFTNQQQKYTETINSGTLLYKSAVALQQGYQAYFIGESLYSFYTSTDTSKTASQMATICERICHVVQGGYNPACSFFRYGESVDHITKGDWNSGLENMNEVSKGLISDFAQAEISGLLAYSIVGSSPWVLPVFIAINSIGIPLAKNVAYSIYQHKSSENKEIPDLWYIEKPYGSTMDVNNEITRHTEHFMQFNDQDLPEIEASIIINFGTDNCSPGTLLTIDSDCIIDNNGIYDISVIVS